MEKPTFKTFLTEITVPQRKELSFQEFDSYEDVVDYLEDEGFDRIGKGAYAEVYASPGSDKVVKVSTQEDAQWLGFIKWARKHPQNPHTPKIYDFKIFIDDRGREMFVAVIEKLQPIKVESLNWSNQENRQFLAWLITRHLHPNVTIDDIVSYMMGNTGKDLLPVLQRRMNEAAVVIKNLQLQSPQSRNENEVFKSVEKQIGSLAKRFEYSNRMIFDLLKQLERRITSDDIFMDIQLGNIMIRPGTGEFVIIDPYGIETDV